MRILISIPRKSALAGLRYVIFVLPRRATAFRVGGSGAVARTCVTVSSWRRRFQQSVLQGHEHPHMAGEAPAKVQHESARMGHELRCPVMISCSTVF